MEPDCTRTDFLNMCSASTGNGFRAGEIEERRGKGGSKVDSEQKNGCSKFCVTNFLVVNEAVIESIRSGNIQHPQAACLHGVVRLQRITCSNILKHHGTLADVDTIPCQQHLH